MIISELHLLKSISVMHVKAWHVFISIAYIDILGRGIFNISHLITIMGGGGEWYYTYYLIFNPLQDPVIFTERWINK